jgi:hypothetical protein
MWVYIRSKEQGDNGTCAISNTKKRRRSGETYLIGGVVNLGHVLVKRFGDTGIGGVMIPIDELNEVK